jgi:hypothetical protein
MYARRSLFGAQVGWPEFRSSVRTSVPSGRNTTKLGCIPPETPATNCQFGESERNDVAGGSGTDVLRPSASVKISGEASVDSKTIA